MKSFAKPLPHFILAIVTGALGIISGECNRKLIGKNVQLKPDIIALIFREQCPPRGYLVYEHTRR